MNTRIKHQLKPIIDANSRILILGSLPSVKSREKNFYYMHPMNRFWKILSLVYEEDFIGADTNQKISLLRKYHIALYDVIESCDILGSSDATITNVSPVDIAKIIVNSNVRNIYLNGRKAYDLFVKYNPKLKKIAIYLPSTSPANARFSVERLYKQWEIIKKAP